MTQQYLAGELSLILGELVSSSIAEDTSHDVGRLRRAVERRSPSALGPMVTRALELTDRMCLASLARGEMAEFVRCAAIGTELWEFGVCAGLLDEGRTRSVAGLR